MAVLEGRAQPILVALAGLEVELIGDAVRARLGRNAERYQWLRTDGLHPGAG